MRLRTLLRISPAIWISPLLVILAVLATSYSTIPLRIPEPYSVAIMAAGTSSVFLAAPICAACAAWEGGRLRRAAWVDGPHVRSLANVALMMLSPIIAVGCIAVAAAVAVKSLNAGVIAFPDLRFVAKTLIILGAHTLLGFAIGLHVPVVVSVPSVLLLDYGWMVLPIALQPFWLRHLTGTWISCCSLSTDLAPQALAGVIAVGCGFAGAGLVLLRPHRTATQVALAIVVVVIAFSVGAFFVRGFGPDPVVARTTPLVCSAAQPRVCVWPEHRERLEAVSAIATQADAAWRAVGVSVPAEFRERDAASPAERAFGFSLNSQAGDVLTAFSYSLLPPYPACAIDGSAPFLGSDAEAYVIAWLDATAGMANEEIAIRFSPDVARAVDSVRARSTEQQRMWFAQNVAALSACDVAPLLEF